MIDLQDITVTLPCGEDSGTTILKNISLHVGRGDWITLVGANGSGKTTLLRTAAGLVPVSGGAIENGSIDSSHPASRPPIGLLLQEPDNQFVASSVRAELLLSIPAHFDNETACARVEASAERFRLTALLDRNPHRLSGGEKQRLALATVWLAEPSVLLLDEPTSYLDRSERDRCVEFVREMNRSGVAVVWATPGGEDIEPGSRVVYLESGAVRFEGTAGDFHAETARKSFPLMAPEDLTPRGIPAAEPSASVAGPVAPAAGPQSILSLRNVFFSYGEAQVLADTSGDVCAGECVGVAGRNGSGKSTLLSLMSGVLRPTRGTVRRSSRHRLEPGRQDVFHLFQNPERLLFAETVHEEVAFGLRSLGVAGTGISDRVAQSLSRVGLDPAVFLDRVPFSLSFGEMRRLTFAIASALNPHLLILDEPAACLDASGRGILCRFIEQALENDSAVVVATHEPGVMSAVVSRWIEL